MADAILKRAVTCTVGAQRGGVTEMMGPGTMVYVTTETRIEPGTELQVGRKVLADYQVVPRDFGSARGMLAVRVRPYSPDASDLRELEELLERIKRAGIPDPGFGDPKVFLQGMYAAHLSQGNPGPVSFEQEWVGILGARALRFPMNTWQHDIEPAVEDMERLLRTHGVRAEIPRSPVQAAFDRYANEADDQVPRRHFCAAIAQEANALLASKGIAARWFQFKGLPWEDEDILWLLVTPDQRAGLLREKLFEEPRD